MGAHLIDGDFQSDKYPTCPRGKVPLSVKDPRAQPFLWGFAQEHRSVDAEFSDDLETALLNAGFARPEPGPPPPRVCVAAMVTDPAGRILMGRRNKDPNRGRWVLPGGGIERGETWAQAAARELLEEAGLDVTIGSNQRPHVIESVGGDAQRGAVILFVRGTATGEPVGGDDLAEPRWFEPGTLPDDLSPITREALRLFDRDGATAPTARCNLCDEYTPESELCPDGNCRDCHKSLSFEECCDGSWTRKQRQAAGLPVDDGGE